MTEQTKDKDMAKKTTYKAILVNDQGCVFDQVSDTNISRIKSWAKDRGGAYQLKINNHYLTSTYEVRQNKVYFVKNYQGFNHGIN